MFTCLLNKQKIPVSSWEETQTLWGLPWEGRKKKKKKAAKSKVQSYPLRRPIVNNGAAKSSLYVYIITDEHGFIPKAAIVNVKTAAGDLAHFTNCL